MRPLLLAGRNSGHDPYADGAFDYRLQRVRSNCPYPFSSREADDWLEGWDDEADSLERPAASELGPDSHGGYSGGVQKLFNTRLLPAGLLLAAALLIGWLVTSTLAAAATGCLIGLLGAWALLTPSPEERRLPPVQRHARGSEGWVQAVSGLFTDLVFIVHDAKIVMANDAARAALGEWIIGQDVRLVIRHPAAIDLLVNADPSGQGVRRAEITGIQEPERRWNMTVLSSDDRHLFVRLSDRSEAQAIEQMRVDFVANASHELRTPLATLLGFTESLRDQSSHTDPETMDRFLAIMHEEAVRMQRLLDDLMSLSRIEADRFSQPQQAVSLAAIVKEARDNCRHIAKQRSSKISVKAAADLPAITGDARQLLQMLNNLIGNALRYGREGTPVRISIEADNDLLHLTVSDEGPGIPEEHLPRITERFYRVDPSRSRSLGGTGLGLSIVKHIVERHRGRLEIRSRVGEGTCVHVFLPIAQEALSSKSHQLVTGMTPATSNEAGNAR
jgi:two-component system phosphate regulon sensor histidine kinase PhoR